LYDVSHLNFDITQCFFLADSLFLTWKIWYQQIKRIFFFFLKLSPLIRQISTTSSARSQIYNKDSKTFLLSYLVCSQIWPNLLVNDHQFCHITKLEKEKDDRQFFYIAKLGGKKINLIKLYNYIYIYLPPSKIYWVLNIFVIENLVKSNLKITRKLWHALGNWNLESSWWGEGCMEVIL
jgi:hypothetical protein